MLFAIIVLLLCHMQNENLNIAGESLLLTPKQVKKELPLSGEAQEHVAAARKALRDMIDGKDSRIFAVVGPCSIHDIEGAKDYAKRLNNLRREVSDVFFIIMRAYFEKPRTVAGWKGLINDPQMDDSFKINDGLLKARRLLLDIADQGLSSATEALDPIVPQYLDDLISWYAIGARTIESQTHREMASGLSTPVGFKNGTDGNIQIAINALLSARQAHRFLGINQDGQCTVLRTRGNPYGHLVLRGGTSPNYDQQSIAKCIEELHKHSLPEKILVDCSHGNSRKNHENQPIVFRNCIEQIRAARDSGTANSICGLMLESYLEPGNQKLESPSTLKYGLSITDACIDWATTEKLLLEGAKALR